LEATAFAIDVTPSGLLGMDRFRKQSRAAAARYALWEDRTLKQVRSLSAAPFA
jgi:hypothetical protein